MGKTWVEAVGEREAQLGVPALEQKAKNFLVTSKTQLSVINTAVAQQNLATACSTAHSLAASAKVLCFMQLHQVALDFETASLANNQAKAEALLKDLAPLVEICSIQLRARYKLN